MASRGLQHPVYQAPGSHLEGTLSKWALGAMERGRGGGEEAPPSQCLPSPLLEFSPGQGHQWGTELGQGEWPLAPGSWLGLGRRARRGGPTRCSLGVSRTAGGFLQPRK